IYSREEPGGWFQELDLVPQHEVLGPYNRLIYIRKTGSRLKKHLTTFQNVYILAPHNSTGFLCVIAALICTLGNKKGIDQLTS
ncbi:hypothetical protein D4R75_03535, partial [bacterium]